MMAPNPASQMWELFQGEPNAYGSDEGKCVYGDAYQAVERHCFKGIPCGIYPIVLDPEDGGNEPMPLVHWGCSDIDNGSLADARLLAKTLWMMDLYPFVELSRSKGYHVWIFAQDWVPAAWMRRTFLKAHEACGIPPKEVNPKQEKPGAKGLSNYVRLPYVGCQADSNGRRIMVYGEQQTPIDFHLFVDRALAHRADPMQLRDWADRYKPPVVRTGAISTAPDFDINLLNGWCRKVLTEGVAEWRFEDGAGGRSGALARLAREVAKSGQDQSVCKRVLVYADDNWGKYVDRVNRDQILDDLVWRAYST